MIRLKLDVIAALKDAGYSTYRIRKEKLFGESVLTKFRNRGYPSEDELNRLCTILGMRPGDLLEYIPDSENTAD